MTDQADSHDETPVPSPDTSSTNAHKASDDASGAVAALQIGIDSGVSLTGPQVQAILKALAGIAVLSTHAHKLEELVASYGTDLNAVSRSLADATSRVSSVLGPPVAYDFEASAKARESLASELASSKSASEVLAAAIRVAVAFV